MDIFTTNQHKLKFPDKQVLPCFGDLMLDCGHCGSRHFRIHVRPTKGRAHLQEIVCNQCLHVWKMDNQGFLDGDGEIKQPYKEVA